MSEQYNQQLGDGQDNLGQAAQSGIDVAKQVSAANATATAVKSGKAASKIAIGTAAVAPWGAIISAVWSSRHTLYRILICTCFLILFFVIALVSLPSIVFNESGASNLQETYGDLSIGISDIVSSGYDYALTKVEQIIADGNYDYTCSMDALINYGHESADYDVYYVLAAYSASMEQKNTSKDDMQTKLTAVMTKMFPVTYTAKQKQITEQNADGGSTTKIIHYVECTIHPFNADIILEAFNIDQDAIYGQFGVTYGQAIDYMAESLRRTLYGSLAYGDIPPLTDAELIAFLDALECSPARKALIQAGLSLVGRVPYFWGGKSAPGWNDEWNTPKLVTSAGSSSTGTLRPYGLDCSGFTDWVYKTALGQGLPAGANHQWEGATAITKAELQPGDLGFLAEPGTVPVQHVLIYAGKSDNGELLWVHCTSGAGVTLNSPEYVKFYRRVNDIDLDTFIPSQGQLGEPIATITAEVTHYCPCSKCCGPYANGITASGKTANRGMVAMSSDYPFGTQIMINGTLYTVEDRGSAIQGNRIDIFVPTHSEALRLGRYQTTAEIYRLGR